MNKANNIILYIALLVMAFFFLKMKCRVDELESNSQTMAQPTPDWLPDDVVTYAELDGRILKIVNRVSPDSVFITTEHVPVESDIRYITRTDTIAMGELEAAQRLLAALEAEVHSSEDSLRIDSLNRAIAFLETRILRTEVEFDTHGFCSEPAAGIAVTTEPSLAVEAALRLYYIGRSGIGIHAVTEIPTEENQGWNISTGLVGDIRFKNWENVAFFAGIDYDFKDTELQGTAGVHVYFRN